MDRPVSDEAEPGTPHLAINPETLPLPTGFSHVIAAGAGRTVYIAGQAGHRSDGTLAGPGLVEQFDQAAANVVAALKSAGANPGDLTWMQIFVTDVTEYQRLSKEIGVAYRRHFGDYYPAMALVEVRRLFDPKATVELMGIAVIA